MPVQTVLLFRVFGVGTGVFIFLFFEQFVERGFFKSVSAHDSLNFFGVESFIFDKGLCEIVELFAVGLEKVRGLCIGGVEKFFDFIVD